jgi:hypothetical protein
MKFPREVIVHVVQSRFLVCDHEYLQQRCINHGWSAPTLGAHAAALGQERVLKTGSAAAEWQDNRLNTTRSPNQK